MKNLEIYTNVS